MPDDELFTLAEQRELGQPDVLRRQVERLLASPRAAAFTENFVGQWLGLREIDATEPSHILYPEFDHLLKVSMIRETELFFDEVLKNDLSLTNFVASDFAMLNGRLARHYGIPGVEGWEFRKTPLPPGSHRGGVLTMAGVLKVTANGTTTSPVTRGAWVLSRILGTPPPPPPDDVAGDRPRHPRRDDDPRAAGQAPLGRIVRRLPPQDRPPRIRPGELRLHRRLARPLPVHRERRSRHRGRPADAVPQRQEGRPRRRHGRRRPVREHRRVQAIAARATSRRSPAPWPRSW